MNSRVICKKKNYKTNLEHYVKSLKHSCRIDCDFLQISAIPESLEAKNIRAKVLWGIPEPKKLRDISILSYFGQCSAPIGKKTVFFYLKPFTTIFSYNLLS